MRNKILAYRIGEFIGKNDNEQYKKPADIGTKPERNLLSDKERLMLLKKKQFAMDELKNGKTK